VKRLLTTLTAAAAALALAGCGALDEDPDAADAPEGATTVKVGYLHTIAVDDKLHYGLENGYFADEDLNIQATQFDTGIAVSQALASGSIDVAIMGGVTSNFPAQGQGKIFMVNSIETATARLYVQPDSGIESVEDLPGKTLITTEGTTADVFLNAAMKANKVDRADVDVVNAAMPDAVQAFVAGNADAIALWVPFDLRVKEGNPEAIEIDDAGNYPDAAVADGWIANNEWYDENEDTMAAIIRAWLSANEAFQEDPEAALAQVQKAAYDGQATIEDLTYQVKFQQNHSNEEWVKMYEDGTVTDIVASAEQAYVDLGGLPEFVDPDEFFDTSLFIETAKEAGVE
jgi:NitT/TauT family transport system substrate-binding protein